MLLEAGNFEKERNKKAVIYNTHFQNFRCQGKVVHRMSGPDKQDNIKTDLIKTGCDSVDYIHLIMEW